MHVCCRLQLVFFQSRILRRVMSVAASSSSSSSVEHNNASAMHKSSLKVSKYPDVRYVKHVYTYIHVYTCLSIYIYKDTHACRRAYMHAYIHAYMHTWKMFKTSVKEDYVK